MLVAVAGGVSAALSSSQPTFHTTQRQASDGIDPAQNQQAEAEAVADALECLVAVASSRSSICMPSLQDVEGSVSCGARAVLEAGGMQAAVAVAMLAVAATLAEAKAAAVVSPSSKSGVPSTSSASSEREGALGQRVALLALQLAGILLQPVGSQGLDVDLRTEVIAGEWGKVDGWSIWGRGVSFLVSQSHVGIYQWISDDQAFKIQLTHLSLSKGKGRRTHLEVEFTCVRVS